MALVIADLGYGNRLSLERALVRNQIPIVWSKKPILDKSVSGYLIPGVGSAASGLAALRASGWSDLLKATHLPVIGICLGFQMLFDELSEDGGHAGLGLLNGQIDFLSALGQNSPKVPHLGWNKVSLLTDTEVQSAQNRKSAAAKLFVDLETDFYFAHSFAAASSLDLVARTEEFVSCAANENVIGFQFHPELSGEAGNELLRRTWSWCKSFRPSI